MLMMKMAIELLLGSCYPRAVVAVFLALACVDGAIAAVSFCQLWRIHSRNFQLGWTRQKVLYLIIGSSNTGFCIYFILSLVPVCRSLLCWSSYCGFLLKAFPEILFLAAFLLLLSFWVDLCHQAASKEDEDDEEEISFRETLLQKKINILNPVTSSNQRKCFSVRRFSQIQSRQKVVILVILLVIILMIMSTGLIWMGNRYNVVDPLLVAQVYVDLFAAANLMLGGALACYGLFLFTKMSRVRSERASSEMWKVAGLAIVSVICFSSSSVVAILTDTRILYSCQLGINGVRTSMFVTIYYFIGSSIPSLFVLWVMRDLPPSPTPKPTEDPRISAFVDVNPVMRVQPRSWTTSTSLQNQISRASPI